MRVAFLGWAPGFDLRRIGGFEAIVRRLADEIAGHGHSVEVVLYDSRSTGDRTESVGRSLVRVREFRKIGSAFASVLTGKYDCILDCHVVPTAAWPKYLLWKRRIGGRSRLVKVYVSSGGGPLWRRIRYAVNNYGTDAVLCISPRLVRSVAAESRAQPEWLPPPVPDRLFQIARERKQSSATVAFLGRLDYQKGAQDVLDTYQRLLRDRSSLNLIADAYLAEGDKQNAALAAQFRALGLSVGDAISGRLAPAASERHVEEVLSSADIVITPYRSLAGTLDLPLVVLEAMAAGCIVLSTPRGDIPSLLPSAWIVKDSAELVSTLARLGDPNERQRMASLVDRSRLASTFATSSVADLLMEVMVRA